MAAIIPVVDPTTSGFVDRHRSMFGGVLALTETHLANGEQSYDAHRWKTYRVFFAAVGDTDTWTTGDRNIRACAWQPNDVDSDTASPFISAQDTGRLGAVITFSGASAAGGWLWYMSR